ncbi:MAG: DedA family protein [Gammaproteobacteria bacterium]|nr:DedA family protein [Gammaproteobacteria bacterium]
MTGLQYMGHLDVHLQALIINYGSWIYAILFAIIFAETGLIIAPFLPGDSLLFAAGSLAAVGGLNVNLLALLLFLAAVAGDNTNYAIGRFVGLRLLQHPKAKCIKQAHLDKTHAFYEKHGHKAIIIARFMPIIRTFMPFTAGIARMTYSRFLSFDLLGGALWVGGIIYLSYFFGNIPMIKENFSFVVYAIIIVSFLPIFWEMMKKYIPSLR